MERQINGALLFMGSRRQIKLSLVSYTGYRIEVCLNKHNRLPALAPLPPHWKR